MSRPTYQPVIKSLFEKFIGYPKRESSSPVRTVGAPTTRSTFGSHLRARRVGEAELNNALYPNHVIKCIHTVHRHKRCYECCCYSCCQAMQFHSRMQIHWREWQRNIGALLDYSVVADFRLSSAREALKIRIPPTKLWHVWYPDGDSRLWQYPDGNSICNISITPDGDSCLRQYPWWGELVVTVPWRGQLVGTVPLMGKVGWHMMGPISRHSISDGDNWLTQQF